MPFPDYYKILGVSRAASEHDLKVAYRGLARRYHPDLHPNNPRAEEVLKIINQAYDVLSDEQQRRQYDAQTAPRPATVDYTPPKSTWSYPNYAPRRHADSVEPSPTFHRKTVLAIWFGGLLVALFFGLWFGRLRPSTPPRITHQVEFVTSTPHTRLLFADVDGLLYASHAQVPKEWFRAGQTLIISYTTSIDAGRVFIGVKGNRLQVGGIAPFASGQWFGQSDHRSLRITIPTSDDYAVFLNLDRFVGSIKLNWAIENP